MKAITLQKRIESKLTLKDGKTIAKCYSDVIDFIVYKRISHPYYYSGAGRFAKCAGVDYISTALKLIGVDFETGNDSPRGGHLGYFVRLTKKGVEQTKEFREVWLKKVHEIKLADAENDRIETEKINLRISEIKELISNNERISDFINRKRNQGDKDRTIAWKLTSENRTPNLYGYSVNEILNAIN